MNKISTPTLVQQDPNAIELLKVWASNGDQHVSLNTSVWEDPMAWGIVLSDLAHHVSIFYEQRGMSRKEALDKILLGFVAEQSDPTDTPKGDLLNSLKS